jgi:hypothetical protein
MTPIWLIEADVFGRSFEPIKAAIRQHGMAWEVVQPGPFLNGVAPSVGGHRLSDEDCVIFSGTFPLMRHIQLHYAWRPGGWCTAEHFDCRSYYPHFGNRLLNHEHAVLAMEDALSRVEENFAQFSKEGRVFLRPCGVQKTFTGRCVDREEFVLALESARYANVPVLIAAPQAISREWRVVVSRGRFVAASQYKLHGAHREAPGCPREVRAYVERLLADVVFRPDPIYLMDIGESENNFSLIELNSFSCSGLYQCDPSEVALEAKGLAIDQWRQGAAAPWKPGPTNRKDI